MLRALSPAANLQPEEVLVVKTLSYLLPAVLLFGCDGITLNHFPGSYP